MSTMLLVPLEDVVVFPNMNLTLTLSVDVGSEERILLVPQHEHDYASVGTVAEITDRVRLPGGGRAVALTGLHRGLAGAAETDARGRLRVAVEERPDDETADGRTRELEREYRAIVEEILELRGDDGRISAFVRSITEPGALADTVGYSPDFSFAQKVRVLETIDINERLALAIELQRERLAEMQVRRRIRDDVEEGAAKQQREYILRKQMESIRKELGEDDASVVTELRQKLEEAELPEAVREQAERELGRLERQGESSPEASMIRNYLDWLLAVPWGKRSDETLDPLHTRGVLDADHAGLDDVKERIVEYIAVRKLREERGIEPDKRSGAILTLVGPPGTGKTSIGESIARALGREFVRMSLGGVRDEAEIRGHRRTYIGALPGRLVRALRDAGTMNPVILLDEVDKVGADWRGDPSAALLEVLDPAQNSTFRDHYLDVELDLSEVVFIATANMVDTIPGPLLDRMEVIRFDGYTVDEKASIARGYLWPRQRERNGLREDEVSIGDVVLETVITDYTREAGVRQLERELGKLLRKTATRIASAKVEAPVDIALDELREALGRQQFYREAAERTAVPGVATGLAVTGHRRRRSLRRGDRGEGRREARPDRPARRRDEGVGADRALLAPLAGGGARGRRGRVRAGVPRPRPGGRDPEGRAERRDHDGDRAGVAPLGPCGQAHRGDDRRGDAAGPRAPDRRAEAEGARRSRRGADGRDHPGAEPPGSRRRAGARSRRADVPSGDLARRGARAGARAGRDTAACGVGAASRFPRRSAGRRASSSGAGRSRSSGRRPRGRCASTSSSRRWGRSRRERSRSGSSSSRRPACSCVR